MRTLILAALLFVEKLLSVIAEVSHLYTLKRLITAFIVGVVLLVICAPTNNAECPDIGHCDTNAVHEVR